MYKYVYLQRRAAVRRVTILAAWNSLRPALFHGIHDYKYALPITLVMLLLTLLCNGYLSVQARGGKIVTSVCVGVYVWLIILAAPHNKVI